MAEELLATEPLTDLSTVHYFALTLTGISMVNNIIHFCKSIESADLIEIPITDCGGLVDDFGGVITMYNMSSPNAARLYVRTLFA